VGVAVGRGVSVAVGEGDVGGKEVTVGVEIAVATGDGGGLVEVPVGVCAATPIGVDG